MSVPAKAKELVERFEQNLDAYKRNKYKETQVRVEFIDPLFESLGWDVHNIAGYAEQYKDVIHEASLKISGKTKAPDYSFRIGGNRKFFVEAKKPLIGLKHETGPAYQLRRYAWSAKLPLSVLTDFEELSIYDCRHRPKPNDRASVARVLYMTYEEYIERWDELVSILSKEAVLKGSFDRYAQETKGKKGTSEVDTEFLKEIEGWREAFARNIAIRNPDLLVSELNYSVQATIDRIIFLRIAEDRGIEEYGRLHKLTSSEDIYHLLIGLFGKANEKFNAGLFDFKSDTLTPGLVIDDKVIKPILKDLYYPVSPYEFSVLSADVLGQVYEQFLGKVIRLTPGHRAKVEEKPDVKKAGGVYYTPSYIVNYIVKSTVGILIEGKTPSQISKLRFLDPACGSGSFLLGIYQYLLDYLLHWYSTHEPEKYTRGKSPKIYQGHRGEWRLSTSEKKRILLKNIYGVDIDRQAVEVTKLSLLLKVLEGETDETLGQQLSLWQERALPNLGENIKCGNSLIGCDFIDPNISVSAEDLKTLNPFEWSDEFQEIMGAGGFDAVISNPPYGALILESAVHYLRTQFEVAGKELDTYPLFIERAIYLCRTKGMVSMIVPTGWYSGIRFRKLRRFFACTTIPEVFINLPYDIFDAWVDTTIFVSSKRRTRVEWPPPGSSKVFLRTFPRRHKITTLSEFDKDIKEADLALWLQEGGDEYLTYADTKTTKLVLTPKSWTREVCGVDLHWS